jgi:RNA-binding protein Musashi
LNYETTDEGLKTYFEQFGEVVDCIVMKYKDTNRSRGFGKII